jgi:hypothetical protein
MKKILTFVFLFIAFSVKAQQAIPTDQPYGKIDESDLEMKSCDFEKDANAEVLISKAELYYDPVFNIVMDIHKRVKIFNDNGKDAANIKIAFYSWERDEFITGLQGETINLVDGKPEITKLDKKQIFTQVIDKYRSQMVFTMPNVKAGSIIEYKYSWNSVEFYTIPTWYFQNYKVPVRYSEISTRIPEYFYFSVKTNNHIPFAINATTEGNGTYGIGQDRLSFSVTNEKKVLVNLPSLSDEPYMSSVNDNLQSIHFHLTSFRPPNGFVKNFSDTWAKVAGGIIDDGDFGGQVKRKLKNEETLVNAAKALKTDDEKIAYLFTAVQSAMKWNGYDDWYTIDGTSEAWDKKTGNSTEINLILYHLLKKSGVNAMPMVVSTRENGRVNVAYTSSAQFNRAVVYIPVDSTKKYILDATGKYNMYNDIPYDVLNSTGMYLNMDDKGYDLIFIDKKQPVRQAVFINAEIKPDGKLSGNAQISSVSYNRINDLKKYKTDGEKDFIDFLAEGDNNLKLSGLKMENIDIDTLPLVQTVNFELDMAGSDDTYIYLNSNLFSGLYKNPFLREERSTDIDFGYLDDLSISGIYKIPAGYKTDALPKSINMTMPDQSVTFRRFVAEQDGSIAVRYSITYNKTIFFKEDYTDFYEFFKKMYEMMNEQIVLKKS